jgi:hypothetical protein
MRFDDQDRAALRALDDFTISAHGEIATVAGEMKVEVVRPAYDGGARLWLTIKLPGGLGFSVMMRRADLLQQAGVEADEDETT